MRPGRRARVALVAGVLVMVSLGGCASETERYCGVLTGQKRELAELATGSSEPGGESFEKTLEVFRELKAEAPGDIADEWSTLVFAYEALVEAFAAADVAPGEYDPEAPPPGVSPSERRRIEGAAAELASPRVIEAADGLEQHARDVCKVDLGLGTGG